MRRHRSRSTIVLAVVASLALAPSSALARASLHLGGHFNDGSAVTLTLNKARSAVTNVNAYVVGHCTDQQPLQVRANLLLAPDPSQASPKAGQRVLTGGTLAGGAFTASGETLMTYTTSEGDATGTLKETVSGKVPRRGIARGTYTASITLTTPSGTTIDCTTDTLHWTALANPRIYSGSTNDGLPVVVELNIRATKVKIIRFAWEAACTTSESSFTYIYSERPTNFPIRRRGAWGDSYPRHENHEDGSKADLQYALGGRLTTHKATGTIAIKLTSTKADGSAGSTCSSGTLRYSALN
jgi:hypothetical protein